MFLAHVSKYIQSKRPNFCSASIISASISGTFENKQKKNKYGSKCLKLPKSSRNAKKNFEKISHTISRTFKCTTNSRTAEVQALNCKLSLSVFIV